jgi:hypothetical protein
MSVRNEGRIIGQSGYWARFAVFMIGAPVLIGFGIYSLFTGDYGLGLISILAVFPLSIWFRFVMMRRCRDIGWPVFLPWSAQGLQFLVFFMLFSGGGLSGDGLSAAKTLSSGSMLIGLADFVLIIALGCFASRQADVDYADVFGGDPDDAWARPARPATPRMPTSYGADPSDYPDAARAREDAAIARALSTYRGGGAEPAPAPLPARQVAPVAAPPIIAAPRAGGFGRKGL